MKQRRALRAVFFVDQPLVIIVPPDHTLGAFEEFLMAKARADISAEAMLH